MDDRELKRRMREIDQSFLGRHGLTIIIITVAFLTSAVILSLIA